MRFFGGGKAQEDTPDRADEKREPHQALENGPRLIEEVRQKSDNQS
jgi:hypothetical protein